MTQTHPTRPSKYRHPSTLASKYYVCLPEQSRVTPFGEQLRSVPPNMATERVIVEGPPSRQCPGATIFDLSGSPFGVSGGQELHRRRGRHEWTSPPRLPWSPPSPVPSRRRGRIWSTCSAVECGRRVSVSGRRSEVVPCRTRVPGEKSRVAGREDTVLLVVKVRLGPTPGWRRWSRDS